MEKLLFENFNSYVSSHNIKKGALLIIGVDNLREINAIYGVEKGDLLLDILKNKILNKLNSNNVCQMENSDEFILFFDDILSSDDGNNLFLKIQTMIEEECKINSFLFTISSGMVLFTENDSIDNLLSNAEYALNKAKDEGKNRLYIYDHSEYLTSKNNMILLKELKKSVENNCEGFFLCFQPIVSIEKRAIIGAEALLRFKNERCGNVSPAVFIPLLEDSSLIIDVGKFIVRNAMEQCVLFSKTNKDFVVHINLSYVQFYQSNFAERVRLLAEKTNVNVNQIVFEITESGFAGKKNLVSNEIEKLSEIGFKLALDDFGTGYSNFIYLKDVDFDIVKIDRTFITEALKDKSKFELLSHMVETVHSIGMKICFEGVETPEDLNKLLGLKPDTIQGYIFGRPQTSDKFISYFNHLDNEAYLKNLDSNHHDTSMMYIMNQIHDNIKDKKKYNHLQQRLLILLTSVLIIFLFVLGMVSYKQISNILANELESIMDNKLDASQAKINSYFYDAINLTETNSVYVTNTYKIVNENNYENILNNIVLENEDIAGSGIWFDHYEYKDYNSFGPYVYRKNNNLILTYEYGGDNYDYFTQEYFAKVKNTLKPLVTDPYYDETMNATIITFSAPILDNNEFVGVITVDLYITDVINIVEGLNEDFDCDSLLITSDGTYICGNEDLDINLEGNLNDKKGSFNEENHKVYYNELPVSGWYICIMVDQSSLYKPIKNLRGILFLTFILTLCFIITAIVLFLFALNRKRKLEYEQKKNINRMHYKALRSSYHLILAINKTNSIEKIYLDDDYKLKDYNYTNFILFMNDLFNNCDSNSRDTLKNYMDLNNILSQLLDKKFISLEIYNKGINDEYSWSELTFTKVNDSSDNNDQILLLLRNINEQKKKEINIQQEKQELISQLQQKNNELFNISITDPLTGVYNRSGIRYYSPSIFQDVEDNDKYFLLLIADIDRLKFVNDSYGHSAGDKAIQEVADILSSLKLGNMVIGRTGGDEFVIYASLNNDFDIKNELIRKIDEMVNKSPLIEINSGISYGYYFGKLEGGKNPNYYYNIADKELYKDKSN